MKYYFTVLFALSACSSSPDDLGGCPVYVSTTDLGAPTVSFSGDVTPILTRSCAAAGDSCHGDPSVVADKRPYLGDADGGMSPAIAAEVRSGLVGVKSQEDLTMNLITAGDPANSFLMHKLDGDQCTLRVECNMPGSNRQNCGNAMPYQAASLLDVPVRDVMRRWISQGAKSN
jgi:hypothetical protein